MIDADFRTIADRDHRAVAGLSMGANQALHLGTGHLDTFAYIAGFSGTMNGLNTDPLDPATAFDGRFKDGEAFNKKVKLLWLGLGTEEPNPVPEIRRRRSAPCWTRRGSNTSISPRPEPRMNG